MKKQSKQVNKKRAKQLGILGLIFYVLFVGILCFEIINKFHGFNPKIFIGIFVVALFVACLGPGYWVSIGSKSKALLIASTILLSLLFLFPGFFVTLALGWAIV